MRNFPNCLIVIKRLIVLADLRTDGANECEQIRIANGMSRLVRKHNRRDSVSVEQIQDTSYSLNVFINSLVPFRNNRSLFTISVTVPLTQIPFICKNPAGFPTGLNNILIKLFSVNNSFKSFTGRKCRNF